MFMFYIKFLHKSILKILNVQAVYSFLYMPLKFPKILTPTTLTVNTLEFKTKVLYCVPFSGTNGSANIEDPDLTTPLRAV